MELEREEFDMHKPSQIKAYQRMENETEEVQALL